MKMLVVSGGLSFLLLGVYGIAPLNANASSHNLVITEVMYNLEGSDTKREWIELYNPTAAPISVIDGAGENSWRFFDSSNHKLTLIQGDLEIDSTETAIIASDAETFLLEHPGFTGTLFDSVLSLKNTEGDIKISEDEGETYFEEMHYISEWGGNGNGFTIERIDPALSNMQSNWREAFVVGGTPGVFELNVEAPETITPPEEEDIPPPPVTPQAPPQGGTSTPPQQSYSTGIIINELYPSPQENEEEFIELFNTTTSSVQLNGWMLSDETTKTYSIPAGTLLKAKELIAFAQSTTKIILNNGGDTVELLFPNETITNSVSYGTSKQGKSWARNNEETFEWSSVPTPQEKNIFPQQPLAVIDFETPIVSVFQSFTLDGSASTGDLFEWRVPFGPKSTQKKLWYEFSVPGQYEIQLKATNILEETSEQSVVITVIDPANPDLSLLIPQSLYETPIINEFLPNPEGSDKEEWIEILNPTASPIDITNWIVDDADGGSKPYVISEPTTLRAYEYIILPRILSKLALNNTTDSVRLLNADEEVVDEIEYSDVEEGNSYARDEDDVWLWTHTTTPGSENIVQEKFIFTEASFEQTITVPTTIQTELSNIRDFENGTSVTTTGSVIAPPNLLGVTVFYIMDGGGIQVYSSKKDFPELMIGDVVHVTGILSENQGEKRIKTSSQLDIIKTSTELQPEPLPIEISDITENEEGALLTISGNIVEKSGRTVYVVDESDEELKVYYKQKIPKPTFGDGDSVTIVGILSETKTGYRLLPRFLEDTIIHTVSDAEVKGIVLTETDTFPEAIPKRSAPPNWPLIFALALVVITGVQTGIILYLLKKQKT
ncbi:MAG: hypothetical protein HN964_04790 [Candidatus Jacksonbacteria bacterium]|nr:hypothetical protein [Candidatus Jacksonbacteria bacterium]